MMDFIFTAVIVLGMIALIAAVVLYVVSKRFAVQEDPRIAEVQEVLPGANCGGCGFAGCSAFADALVKGADNGSLDGMLCPVGGQPVMGQVADLLGMPWPTPTQGCGGSLQCCPSTALRWLSTMDLHTCAAIHATGAGETAVARLSGCGDCVQACRTSPPSA
jgi:Na+-translocating ferredoxin:NAD+ oxidoreductase RNF subunit RnfB